MFTVLQNDSESSFDTISAALENAFLFASLGRTTAVSGPRGWIWKTEKFGLNGRFVGDFAR